jgi:hypothetical protein
MALWIYYCPECNSEFKKISTDVHETVPCKCGGEAILQLPSNISTDVMEMRDKVRGKQVKRNFEAKLKKRMKDHHDKYEIQEKIDKYGLDDAIRNGWCDIAMGKKK